MQSQQNIKWHSVSADKIISELQTNVSKGLTVAEAHKRLKQYGLNVLSSKKKSLLLRLIEPFTSLFVIVLLVALVISLVTNEQVDAYIIAVVVIINSLIYYFQEYSVSRVLISLKKYEKENVSVRRDGQTIEISAQELVPGDIVYIFEGLKIPADGRIIEANNLSIDESILTGESLPVSKHTDILDQEKEIYDRKNMAYKGTLAQAGSGLIVVCSTGNNTELGEISSLTSKSDTGKTPIEKKIDDITKKIIFGVCVVATVVFALALLRGIVVSEAFRFTLSLVVSVVPEGLPVTLTIVLLLGAKKMARHNALVKKLSAIETMGAITLIATDKTGTITKNKLEIATSFPSSLEISAVASASITEQNGVALDPLDTLLKQSFSASRHFGKKVGDLPFHQDSRMSGAVWQRDSHYYIQLKGAPEAVIQHSTNAVKEKLHEYTSRGYRTIAFGHVLSKTKPSSIEEIITRNIVFDGIVGLADPIRSNVPAAIAEARTAGINVVMLTGDHNNTAEEIARQAGLIMDNNEVADSRILEKVTNKKLLRTMLTRVNVFGRVLPKHKYNFLKSLKNTEVTAMTGDGVNDIPALVEADAGLAMGSGTDAAKDASDIVLLNNDFSTIIDAVRIGRATIANIQKILFYLLSSILSESITIFGALLAGFPLPIAAVQILWINLVTETTMCLPLGISRSEHHQMKHRPEDPKNPLLTNIIMSRIILFGTISATAVLSIYWLLLPKGYDYAQTAAFTALVVAQWANALNANFERRSWLYNFRKPNYWLWAGILVSALLQAIVLFGPLQKAFGIVPLTRNDLLLTLLVPTVLCLVAVDLHKLLYRHRT